MSQGSATLVLLAFAAAFVAQACSPTIITKKDGQVVKGTVLRHDKESITLRRSESPGRCKTVITRGNQANPVEIELHCDDDPEPEARQVFTYDEEGKVVAAELDVCADGTVDARDLCERSAMTGRPKCYGAAHEPMIDATVEGAPCVAAPPPGPDDDRDASPAEVTVPRIEIEEIDHFRMKAGVSMLPGINVRLTGDSYNSTLGFGVALGAVLHPVRFLAVSLDFYFASDGGSHSSDDQSIMGMSLTAHWRPLQRWVQPFVGCGFGWFRWDHWRKEDCAAISCQAGVDFLLADYVLIGPHVLMFFPLFVDETEIITVLPSLGVTFIFPFGEDLK